MEDHMSPYPEINYSSPEWERIKRWLIAERASISETLASKHTTWEDTLYHRGRASMIDTMLGFEELAASPIFSMPR